MYVFMCTGFDVGLGDIVTFQNVTTVTVLVTLTDDIIASTANVSMDKVVIPGEGVFNKCHITPYIHIYIHTYIHTYIIYLHTCIFVPE